MNNSAPLTIENFFPRAFRSLRARMKRHGYNPAGVLNEFVAPALEPYRKLYDAGKMALKRKKFPLLQQESNLDPRLYTGDPAYVKHFVLELTNHCNLRCRYCHQNKPDFEATPELNTETFEDVLEYLARHPIETIDITGGGDILMASDWAAKCDKLLALGIKLDTTINLGKILDDAQVKTLSRFNLITVSIDTLDRKILSDVRKSVDIRTIIYNMMRIRAAALKQHYEDMRSGRKPEDNAPPLTIGPQWVISAVYSAEVVHRLPELASFAVTFGAKAFQIQDLMEFNSIKDNVQSVWTLTGQAAIDAAEATQLAVDIATHHKLNANMPPDLLGRLGDFARRARVAGNKPSAVLKPESEKLAAPEPVLVMPPCPSEAVPASIPEAQAQDIKLTSDTNISEPGFRNETALVSVVEEDALVAKNIGSTQSTYNPVPERAAGMTRDCTDPWSFMQILSNTGIRPCCFSNLELGSVQKSKGGIEGALNSDTAINLRKQLLTGKLDEFCAMCSYRSMTDIDTFQKKIALMVDTADKAA